MDHTGEERIARLRAANVDDAGVRELVTEHFDDALESLAVERPEHTVDEDPLRRLQQHPREGESQLLILAQLAIPTPRDIEERHQTLETEPAQRLRTGVRIEGLGLERVGQYIAQ